MKLITLEKIYKSLKFEEPEIIVDPLIAKQALIPIRRMLDISAKLGL